MTNTPNTPNTHTPRHISPAIAEFAVQECERLRAENEQLRAMCTDIAALADGQGRLNMMQVAAGARALLARLDEAQS